MTTAFIIVSLYLVYHDIRFKKVPNLIILFLFATVLIFKFPGQIELQIALISGGIALAIFLIIYAISRGKMGMGDIKYTTVSALHFGYEFWLKSIVICSATALIVSLILLISGKINQETRIPFIPFLVFGILVQYVKETYL